MKISRIELLKETPEEHLTLITYKNFFGRVKTATFITRKDNIATHYAKSGDFLDVGLWKTVNSFLRTGDKFINIK